MLHGSKLLIPRQLEKKSLWLRKLMNSRYSAIGHEDVLFLSSPTAKLHLPELAHWPPWKLEIKLMLTPTPSTLKNYSPASRLAIHFRHFHALCL